MKVLSLLILLIKSLPSVVLIVAFESTFTMLSLPPLPLIARAVVSPSMVSVIIMSLPAEPFATVSSVDRTVAVPSEGVTVAQDVLPALTKLP